MMKTFILIILLSGAADGGRAVTEVRGFTRDACAVAASQVNTINVSWSFRPIAVCVSTE